MQGFYIININTHICRLSTRFLLLFFFFFTPFWLFHLLMVIVVGCLLALIKYCSLIWVQRRGYIFFSMSFFSSCAAPARTLMNIIAGVEALNVHCLLLIAYCRLSSLNVALLDWNLTTNSSWLQLDNVLSSNLLMMSICDPPIFIVWFELVRVKFEVDNTKFSFGSPEITI